MLGICVDRPDDQEAILVTRYLEYSMSYRWLFSSPRGEHSAEQLLDTLVELLVRLHLAGVFWGDCSLSNTLFRPDAGALTAYLVDAETVERHPTLSPGQRAYDVDLARERVGAELLDLRFGGLLPDGHRPVRDRRQPAAPLRGAVGRGDPRGGLRLEEQQFRVAERLQRLNDLGFDVGEVELITSAEGARLRVQTRVAEPGQHRRELFRLTGLEVQESQARRLLNDMRAYRAWLEQRPAARCRRAVAGAPLARRGLPAGRRRDPGRIWPAGWRRRRSSTRCSSTAGSCPSRRGRDVGTAEAAAVVLRDRAAADARRRSPRRR